MWGPGREIPNYLLFNGAPYTPFSKGDKLGKVADWAADPAKEAKDQRRAQSRGFRDPYHAYGASSSSFFTSDETENSWSFSVVENVGRGPMSGVQGATGGVGSNKKAVLRSRGAGSSGRLNGPAGTRAISSAAVSNAQAAAASSATSNNRGANMNRGPRTMTIGSATLHNRRGGNRQQNWVNDKSRSRKPSVPIGPDWKHIQTNSFSELQKLGYEVVEPVTVGEYGYIQTFDKKMDKLVTTRKLQRVDVTEYNVSSSEDPIIKELASEHTNKGKLNVFATDSIIALLMCAPKSNNPWDVIITKKNNQIFFDKRENSAIDLPPVDENSMTPPAMFSESKTDSASALALEASYINLNFNANVVLQGENNRVTFPLPNPFSSGNEPVEAPLLPKGYIYKRFNLESNPEDEPINLFIRMEIDAAVERDNKLLHANVFALNEYGGPTKTLEWKDRFNVSRGAIVTAEMKNNLNKLSQWTARSLLAGVPVMKIGFVSRTQAKDNQSHEIIHVLSQSPTSFAGQLNFSMRNGWGIVKSLVNVFADLEDGKYVLLRDPTTPSVLIYQVPDDTTFEDK